MVTAEIIAIGTELTSGAKLDTNSQWLSLQLADLGIVVNWHTTVADDLAANIQAIRHAVARVDVVLISGGLGPTLDDLTREALAAVAQVELQLDQASLEHVEGFFKSRGRTMPERNRVQALFPQGAQPLANPIGTAPGIWMTIPRAERKDCLIAAMPGVPSELFKMYYEQVQPRLTGGASTIRRARIHCFGLGESQVEEMLGDLTARGRDPEIGITAHEATITLRIIAHGSSASQCQSKIDCACHAVRERLGDHVFGTEDDELEDVVIRLLAQQGRTLLTLEDATDGHLAQCLASAQRRWLATPSGQQHLARELPRPFVHGVARGESRRTRRPRLDSASNQLLLQISKESRLTGPGGRELTRVVITLKQVEQIDRAVQLDWAGNPAIFCSRTSKSALDILRRTLLDIDLGPYSLITQR